MTSPSQTRPDGVCSNPALRAGGWTAAKVLAHALEFGAWIVLARSLAPSTVGQLAVGVLVARYLGIIADWGAHHIGARIVVEDHATRHPSRLDQATTLIHQRNLLCLAVSVAFLAGCWLLDLERFWPLVALASFRGANRDWVALGHGLHLRSAAPTLVFGAVVLAASATVSSAAEGARWFGIAAVAALALSVGLNRMTTATDVRAGARVAGRPGWSATATRGAWITAMTLADQLLATADVGLLGILDSSAAAGVYSTVYRLPNSLLLIAGLATAAAVPALRSAGRPGTEAVSLLRRAAAIGLSLGLVVVVAGVALTAAIEPLFGPAYVAGRNPLIILFAATAIVAATVPLRALLLAWDAEAAIAKLFVAAAATNLAGNLVLIPIWGMVGAALATLGVQLMLGLALWSRAVVVITGASSAPEVAESGRSAK